MPVTFRRACGGRISITPPQFAFFVGPSGSSANPGTFESPWDIASLNNATKRGLYSGTRVGLKDGDYDVSAMTSSSAFDVPVINCAGGTSGSPTIIESVNARQAWLKNTSTGGTRSIYPAIGHRLEEGYITFRGLKVSGGLRACILVYATFNNHIPGVVIEDCEAFDLDNQQAGNPGIDNTDLIWVSTLAGGIVRNNLLYDCRNRVDGNANGTGIKVYNCMDLVVRQNTLDNCACGVFLKAEAVTRSLVELNFMRNCSSGAYGYYDQPDDGSVTTTRGNVIAWDSAMTKARRNLIGQDFGTTMPWRQVNDVYGNTLVTEIDPAGAVGLVSIRGSTASRVRFYNNALARLAGSAPAEFGDLALAAEARLKYDYNRYPGSPTLHAINIADRDNSAGTHTTLGSWQTYTGDEAASTFGAAGLELTGSGPARYKAAVGSALLGNGRVGGVPGGDAVNIGAYASSGQTEQIGCNFS